MVLHRPLPFDELLAALKDSGLPIGLREHLLVGRLLDHWPGTELASLRSALAALLARNPEEVALVRATFDALYGEKPEAPPPPPPPLPPLPEPHRRWGRVAGIMVAGIMVAAFLVANSLGHETPPSVEVPAAPEAEKRPADAPEPPTIPDEILEISENPRPDLLRALEASMGVSAFLFLWLYGGRIRREARRLGRSRWRREADALPRPYRYQPDLSDLAAPFPATVLDEAAQILGRRAPAPPRPYDLDIDRTLQSTLEAGLAPEVVLWEQLTTPMLLVLEDTGGEMQPWRRTVRALLTGLAARGVPLDLWHFQTDARRVFRTPGGVTMTLERLARLHGAIPVLVISAGEGVLHGKEGRLSPWVSLLSSWPQRAWLHPVPDSGYWRPALREAPVDVLPLTPGGVLMAARRLAGINAPPRSTAPVFPHRPVTPLDVDRLRWLLTLVPGRDSDLAERLRQQIFPSTSPAALVEALESTPLRTPPPLAPPAEAVHAALADLIANTPPLPGSAAYERWRLDVALQEIQVPERQDRALEELQDLARGPLATEVERAVGRLPLTLQRPLRRSLETRAEKDGRAVARVEGPPRPHWRRPDLVELGSTLVCLLLLFWGLRWVLTRPARVEVVERYTLVLNDFGPAGFNLLAGRKGQAPMVAQLYRGNSLRGNVVFIGYKESVSFDSSDRGHWYYLRASFEEEGEEKLAISNRVWVPQLGELTNATEPSPPTDPNKRVLAYKAQILIVRGDIEAGGRDTRGALLRQRGLQLADLMGEIDEGQLRPATKIIQHEYRGWAFLIGVSTFTDTPPEYITAASRIDYATKAVAEFDLALDLMADITRGYRAGDPAAIPIFEWMTGDSEDLNRTHYLKAIALAVIARAGGGPPQAAIAELSVIPKRYLAEFPAENNPDLAWALSGEESVGSHFTNGGDDPP